MDTNTWPPGQDATVRMRHPRAALVAAVLAVLALAWLATLSNQRQFSGHATGFSAANAMSHASVLAVAPRPIGSDANREAREYILARLRALGLEPHVQRAIVQRNVVDKFRNTHVTLGVVHNILVRKPGADPGARTRPAVLVSAHYDSPEQTLGAALGAGAATMLETLRALRNSPPLASDVLFLFADGEAVRGLGEKGFVEQHPWAREVGLAIKFGAAGVSGPLALYGASGTSADASAGLARAAPQVGGSTLMPLLQRLFGQNAGPLTQLDAPVLRLATVGGPRAGSALDTPAALAPATLQQTGDAMLSLLRHFGQERLSAGRHSHTSFELPLAGRIGYPSAVSWLLALLAWLLLAEAWRVALVRAQVELSALVKGCFGYLVVVLAFVATSWLLRDDLPAAMRGWDVHGAGVQAHGRVLAITALATAFLVGLLRLHAWAAGPVAAVVGTLSWMAVFLLVLCFAAPDAAHLVAWPLLAALLAFRALHPRSGAPVPGPRAMLIALCAAIPALLLFLPALRETSAAFAPSGSYHPQAILLFLMVGLCSAPLALVARGAIVRLLAAAGLAGLATAPQAAESRATDAQPNHLVYFVDMPSWSAYWLMPPIALDSWTKEVFRDLDRPHIHADAFGWDSPRQWYARAPRGPVAFPEARLLLNARAPRRHVEFTLQSKNSAPRIDMWIGGARPVRTTLNGRVLTEAVSYSWRLTLLGMGSELLRFRFDLLADPSFHVKVQERITGLPLHLLPPRPADAAPRLPNTGTTISADTLRFH